MESALLARSQDKITSVRVAAVTALRHFQDPARDCPVIQEYLRLLQTDPNKYVKCDPCAHAFREVRKEVLTCLRIHASTLDALVERTRDIEPEIRKGALNKFQGVDPRKLKIKHRILILESCISDRDGSVKEECAQLSKSWLRSQEDNLIKVFCLLDVV